MSDTLIYLSAGSLGVLLQVLLKIGSLKKTSKAANMQFVFSKYLQDDWPTILASFVSVGLCIFFIPDLLALKPDALKYGRIGFGFVGFTGSSIVQGIFSATSKKLLNVIDIKTNIADGVVPPITEENKDEAHEALKGDTLKGDNPING